VFVDLARQARKLSAEVMLGGWLHRHTCYVAANLLRGERRRQTRERRAVEMNALETPAETNRTEIAPVLDEAINQLGTEDRAAIILRFFEQSDFRSVGQWLGVSEDTARMRVNRALEKLRLVLKRRGATLSTAMLVTLLASEAIQAAPAGLAAALSAGALAGVSAGSVSTGTLFKIIAMTKIKAGVIGALVVAGLAAPLTVYYRAQVQLQERDAALQQQADQLNQLLAENSRLSNLVSQAAGPVAQDQSSELLRLRGEVGVLNQKLAASKTQPEQVKRETQVGAEVDAAERQKEIAIAKMIYTKAWTLAFWQYADKNQGQFPTNFDQAFSFLPEEAKSIPGLAPDQFEITYQGSLTSITNPQSIIVLREKDAIPDADGAAHRAYGFADGHSEIHKAADGNFQPWEQQHLISPPVR
jgi:RNA polymerase sigma factor (sigma-70 family)